MIGLSKRKKTSQKMMNGETSPFIDARVVVVAAYLLSPSSLTTYDLCNHSQHTAAMLIHCCVSDGKAFPTTPGPEVSGRHRCHHVVSARVSDLHGDPRGAAEQDCHGDDTQLT